jgi:aldehyde dehydrogenase (NAD+)
MLTINSIEEAIRFVNERPKPLAQYVYAEDLTVVDKILAETTSGGACVNESVFHFAVPHLPLGGVGPSGMGKYHGEWGFRDFSNAKGVLDRETSFDDELRYPPYTPWKLTLVKTLLEIQAHVPRCLVGTVTSLSKPFLRRWGNKLPI